MMMYPQAELENYKLQVELLQEKLKRSEENRQQLSQQLEHILKKRNEHDKMVRTKTRQKYQQFVEEQQQRNERNKKLVQMLEHIDQKAAAMSARSERLKMMKMQYEMYFAKLMQTQTMRCIQTMPLTHNATAIPVLLPAPSISVATPLSTTVSTSVLTPSTVTAATLMSEALIKSNESNTKPTTTETTASTTATSIPTEATRTTYQINNNLSMSSSSSAAVAVPAITSSIVESKILPDHSTAITLKAPSPANAAFSPTMSHQWTLAMATPTPAGMLLANTSTQPLPLPQDYTIVAGTSAYDYLQYPIGYVPRIQHADELTLPLQLQLQLQRHLVQQQQQQQQQHHLHHSTLLQPTRMSSAIFDDENDNLLRANHSWNNMNVSNYNKNNNNNNNKQKNGNDVKNDDNDKDDGDNNDMDNDNNAHATLGEAHDRITDAIDIGELPATTTTATRIRDFMPERFHNDQTNTTIDTTPKTMPETMRKDNDQQQMVLQMPTASSIVTSTTTTATTTITTTAATMLSSPATAAASLSLSLTFDKLPKSLMSLTKDKFALSPSCKTTTTAHTTKIHPPIANDEKTPEVDAYATTTTTDKTQFGSHFNAFVNSNYDNYFDDKHNTMLTNWGIKEDTYASSSPTSKTPPPFIRVDSVTGSSPNSGTNDINASALHIDDTDTNVVTDNIWRSQKKEMTADDNTLLVLANKWNINMKNEQNPDDILFKRTQAYNREVSMTSNEYARPTHIFKEAAKEIIRRGAYFNTAADGGGGAHRFDVPTRELAAMSPFIQHQQQQQQHQQQQLSKPQMSIENIENAIYGELVNPPTTAIQSTALMTVDKPSEIRQVAKNFVEDLVTTTDGTISTDNLTMATMKMMKPQPQYERHTPLPATTSDTIDIANYTNYSAYDGGSSVVVTTTATDDTTTISSTSYNQDASDVSSYEPTYATIDGNNDNNATTPNAEVDPSAGTDGANSNTDDYATIQPEQQEQQQQQQYINDDDQQQQQQQQQQQDYSNVPTDYGNYDGTQYDGGYDPNAYPGYTYDETTGQYVPDQQQQQQQQYDVGNDDASYAAQSYESSEQQQPQQESQYEIRDDDGYNYGPYTEEQPTPIAAMEIRTEDANEMQPAAVAPSSVEVPAAAAAAATAEMQPPTLPAPTPTIPQQSATVIQQQQQPKVIRPILATEKHTTSSDVQKKKKRVNFVDNSDTDESIKGPGFTVAGGGNGVSDAAASSESDFDFSIADDGTPTTTAL